MIYPLFESGCRLCPIVKIFILFSNPLFDSNDDFTSSDDESLSDEDVPEENFKIYSNPLFDEEIISTKIDPHHFNAESDLIESLLNRDTSIKLNNSSPRPPEKLNFDNSDAVIEPFSPSPIPIEGSDSLMEDIDIFIALDDSIPSGIRVMLTMTQKPRILPTQPTLSLCLVIDTLFPFSSKNEIKVFNSGILASNEEKSPHLLSHRGFKAF
ncbi:hypothetical protein Tco_1133211 [Tanacetum coccineum]